MILFISNSGECLPIVWRLKREGAEVEVYIHHPKYKGNYAGMINQVNLGNLRRTIDQADQVVFDITHPNHKTKEDRALLKMFGIKASSRSVFGPVADKIRKGCQVIGCAEWCEEIELDRKLGSDIGAKIGMSIAETHDFKTLRDGVKFLKGRRDRWVFKPHDNADLDLTYVEKYAGELLRKMEGEYEKRLGQKVDYMLQKVVEGVEISTEGWFDGMRWWHFNHTIEDKRLMGGNLGPAIGSQSNTVWMKKGEGLLVKELTRLTPWLKKANYIGPVDINAIVTRDRQPYFLEFSPRFGYDAIYCLLTLLKTPLRDFFTKQFKGTFADGFASSQRLSIPPYPYSNRDLLLNMAKEVPIEGSLTKWPWFWAQDVRLGDDADLICAGSDGILGIATARGSTVREAVGQVHRQLRSMKIGAYLQYRLDGRRRPEEALETLQKWRVYVE